MFDKIKKYLGLGKESEYVKNTVNVANIKTSLCLAVMIVIFEMGLLLKTVSVYMFTHRDKSLMANQIILCVVLIAVGCVVLIYDIVYLVRNKGSLKLGAILRLVFSLICIAFGIFVSSRDYAKGEQILTFVIMISSVTCLMTWKPWVSFIILSGAFGFFYMAMGGEKEVPDITAVNLLMFYVFTLVTSFNLYFSKYAISEKDESLEEKNGKLQDNAKTDELTGIANMRKFNSSAPRILASRGDTEKIFLFLDIKNFKGYNEKHGFEKGNELLRNVSKYIAELFKDDLYARFSEDHFAILANNENIEERLDSLREKIINTDKEIHLDLRAGGYRPKKKLEGAALACDYARNACAEAKKLYKGYYREYNEELAHEIQRRQYIINNIDKAIEKGYIKVYYQPVVFSDSRRLCGVEALARWIDPDYGMISPGVFVPILEQFHQIHKLDIAILELVCKDMYDSKNNNNRSLAVSVNFSRLDFVLGNIIEKLEELTKKYSINKRLLHIEITESTLAEDSGALKENIVKLREMGYPVWLDDFGSAYSSLNTLKDYDFDVVKLDMQFLSGFEEENKKGRMIIDNVVRLSHNIGMKTLCEGVETESEAEFLNEVGCERLQGYLIGKPMPREDISAFINEGKYVIDEKYVV